MHDELRSPPWSESAEMQVLGTIVGAMGGADTMARVVELVRSGDFYREAHRRVFAAAESLFKRGEPVDPVLVGEELARNRELDAIGGAPYLMELMDAAGPGENIEHHAKIIADYARLRRIIEAGSKIVQLAYEPGVHTVDEVTDEAGRLVLEAVMHTETGGLKLLKHDLYDTFTDIEKRVASGGGITGLSTGFPELDEMTGGLQNGDLIILAARPSVGKTALATSIILQAGIQKQVPVAFFSVEMSKRSINYRMLCHEAYVDLSRVLKGRLVDTDYPNLAQAAGHLSSAPIYVDDAASLNVMQLNARVRRLKMERPDLGLIVVDYLQKMNGPGENRTQEITGISSGLKAIAKEMNVPMIALSQLSRNNEQRADKRPQLSDLRESGSIEQDADVVMFLYPAYRYDKQIPRGNTELIIAKQRNGPVGEIQLHFREENARFSSMGMK